MNSTSGGQIPRQGSKMNLIPDPGDVTRPIIQVSNLSKQFDDIAAVDNISFSVAKGEIIGLLGPNGAGKTTTIQLLLGLTTPTSGQIRILGLDLNVNRRKILERVNFSSTYTQLPANLTVWENLNVFGRLYGIRKPEKVVSPLLEFLDIGQTRHMRTGQLSTGQMTRLNLAKALINDPQIIFLDEPTASLDPEIASRVRSMLRQIQKEKNITIVYTSHNMFEVEIMCDRVLFMSRGKIVLEGAPDEIKRQAMAGSLEEVFISIARNGRLKDTTHTAN